MTEKHTPGPWAVEIEADVEDHERTIYVCHAGTVCDATTICNLQPPHWATVERRKADARLIAAAPDLLAAAMRADKAMYGRVHSHECLAAMEDIRAAIAKATGADAVLREAGE